MSKYAFVTQDLDDEAIVAITDIMLKTFPEVGWTRHLVTDEDFLPEYDAHKLVLKRASIGNPPKEKPNV